MGDEMRERERVWACSDAVFENILKYVFMCVWLFPFDRRHNGILMQWCNAGVVLRIGRLAEHGVVVFLPCCFTGAAPGCWMDLHSNGQRFRKKRPSLFPLYVLFSYCGLAGFVCFLPQWALGERDGHTNTHKYAHADSHTQILDTST